MVGTRLLSNSNFYDTHKRKPYQLRKYFAFQTLIDGVWTWRERRCRTVLSIVVRFHQMHEYVTQLPKLFNFDYLANPINLENVFAFRS